jgi:hypothetical protein
MKSKLIIALAMLGVSVATAGVITVSDPGQLPSGEFISTGKIVECIHVLLTASNVNEQVYITLNQRTAGSLLDADLFVSGSTTSNKFTGKPVILEPFPVTSGKTNDIIISARINATAPSANPVPIALDLTSVSNSMSSSTSITGILPIKGTIYVVGDPRGRFTSIEVFYKYSGAPLDTNGVRLDLVFLHGQGDPSIAYEIQFSPDLKTWSTLFSPRYPDWNGGIQSAAFMYLPPQCFYRLKSQ